VSCPVNRRDRDQGRSWERTGPGAWSGQNRRGRTPPRGRSLPANARGTRGQCVVTDYRQPRVVWAYPGGFENCSGFGTRPGGPSSTRRNLCIRSSHAEFRPAPRPQWLDFAHGTDFRRQVPRRTQLELAVAIDNIGPTAAPCSFTIQFTDNIAPTIYVSDLHRRPAHDAVLGFEYDDSLKSKLLELESNLRAAKNRRR